jgi:multidrug resistance efflux pump
LPKKYPLNSAVHQHKENLKNNKAELQKWEKLHKDGVITDEEFKMQKAALE